MARATVTVQVADLPEVQALVRRLGHERDDLRQLLQQWEPRVICPQCGQHYSHRACGPTHAAVFVMVQGVGS